MNHTINDRFMNPNVHGYPVAPFKLDGDREPPEYIPEWRIARSNARSMGKATFTHQALQVMWWLREARL